MMPLAYAREGSLVRVSAIRAGKGLYRRLHELGIVEGKILRVVKTQGPGPVIIEIVNNASYVYGRVPCPYCPIATGGRLLLGFGVAMKIMVEEVKPP